MVQQQQQQHAREQTQEGGVLDEILDNTQQALTKDALGELTRAEIDIQIATAKRYPRSIREFQRKAAEMATLNEEIASSCMYALPRDGKTIEGPSARLAEIVAVAWGNLRTGARVINIGDSFLTSQGFTHDLESNLATNIEVQRRITNKHGRRFSDDMIVVTGNAASSIALRNVVFKVVPKAYWWPVYLAARKTAIGDAKTLDSRRQAAVGHFAKMGVGQQTILAMLDRKGMEDVTLDDLAVLHGLATAIKDGDISIEEAFRAKENRAGKIDELLAGRNGNPGSHPPKDEPKSEAKTEPAQDAAKDQGQSEPQKNETKNETKDAPPDRDAMVDQFTAAITKATDKQDIADLKGEVHQNAEFLGGDAVDMLIEKIEQKSASMGTNGNGKRQKAGEKF